MDRDAPVPGHPDLGLVIVFISSTTRKPGEPDHGGDPRRTLDERLARGDIDAAEYQRISDLIAHGGQAPASSGSGR